MKCTNPVKCNGEMKPLYKSAHLTECVKCGYRIPTPKAEPKKPVEKVKEFVTEIKETN